LGFIHAKSSALFLHSGQPPDVLPMKSRCKSELAVDLCYEPGRLSRCDFGAEPLLDGGPKTIARVSDPLDACKRVIDCFTGRG
jgi:hypothetical protein